MINVRCSYQKPSVICSFDSRKHESSNRPSVMTNLDGIKQTASQSWCLLRFLPQLIGNKVPVDHPGWHIFLLLRLIMDIVFSPVITEDVTYWIQSLVEEHHESFLEVI